MNITSEQFSQSLAQEPLERWASYLVLVLQDLEVSAMDIDASHPEGFEQVLESLRDRIDDRLNNHAW